MRFTLPRQSPDDSYYKDERAAFVADLIRRYDQQVETPESVTAEILQALDAYEQHKRATK